MALDFPTSPSVGQKFPASPIANVPTYTWDGEKWTTIGGALGSGGAATALPLMDATPALVGVGSKYAREDHVHPVDSAAVRTEQAQALTAAQQQQARQNIYAAPFAAMAYNGLQINGNFEVSQEFGYSAPIMTSGKYICDGWVLINTGTAVMSAGVYPTLTNTPGFPYYLQVAVTTAQATLTGNQQASFFQPIEGWRIAKLGWGFAGAQPITIGFWTAHARTGVYSVTVRNSADDRSYTTTYTQNVATTWEYKTVTIPGCIDGTWFVDNRIGMRICFVQACGPTFIAPAANTWYAATYVAAPGQVNAVAATTDVFRIEGVIILPGNEAPSAARSPFIMRPFDQEIQLCRRHFYRRNIAVGEVIGTLQCFNATLASGPLFGFQSQMRAVPTVNAAVVGNFAVYSAGASIVSASVLAWAPTTDFLWLGTSTFGGSLVGGNAALFIANLANTWIQVDARL
jgi:hypothetical protein